MNYQIGKWKFDSETGLLKSDVTSNTLPKLLKQLLMLFIDSDNTVINREEIIEILWKNKYVNENALSRTVAELRKELHDSANQPDYIKTIPKKGYQFIHTVIDVQQAKKNKRKSILNNTVISLSAIALFSILFLVLKKDNFSSHISLALNNAQRITAKQGMENQPTLSPDGNKMAYTKIKAGKYDIVIYDIVNQEELLVISKINFSLGSPAFSNSGNEIIATAQSRNGCQLLWKNLKNLEEKLLAECTVKNESVTLDWSNDDRSIFYSNEDEKYGTLALWELNLNTLERQQLTFPESAEVFDTSPKLSPNGNYLSFSRGNHTVRNIYIKKLNSELPPKILTENTHYTVSHDWIADQHIIMDSDQTGERLLWMVDVQTNQSIALGARGAQYPTVNQKANKLLFQVAQFEANIWMVDLKTNEKSLIINSTKYDNNPVFHPFNTSFAYTSNRLSYGTIWVYDGATKSDTKVFEIPKVRLTRPSWSIDGEKLLATANDHTGLWSYELELKTGAYRKLPFNLENYAAVYIEDEIYAMSKPKNGESTLLKLDSNEKMLKLNINGLSRFMPLSNHKLAISKANKNGIFTINLDGSNEAVLIPDFHASLLNHWSTSKNDVYYRFIDTEIGIWKINSETKIKQRVTDFYPSSVGPSISINPQQTKALVTKTDWAESDIFITSLKNQ